MAQVGKKEDGADKRRRDVIPDGGQIRFRIKGRKRSWTFVATRCVPLAPR
jgi:hypothetical protein